SPLFWFCSSPQLPNLVVDKISTLLAIPQGEAQHVLAVLIHNQIILDTAHYQLLTKRYHKWFFYGWWLPLHYLLMTLTSHLPFKDASSSEAHTFHFKKKVLKKKDFYKPYPKNKSVALPLASPIGN